MSRVGLAISAYRSDASVERLLRLAMPMIPRVFEHVLVVDSLGSGAIPALIEKEGWSSVEYVNANSNLGSAGNLNERLRRSAERGLDFVYAVNHDGEVAEQVVRRLVEFASQRASIGAAYPLRIYSRRGGLYDFTGTSRFPRPFLGSKRPPTEAAMRVYWASSNCSLYACKPLREGILPYGDFWMGWEDLAYGWQLEDAGFEQWVVRDAVVVDDYEYGRSRVGPIELNLTQKPNWYWYYIARNLLLTARRSSRPLAVRGALLARVIAECLAAATVRSERREKLGLLLKGVVDGTRGRAGKGPVP